MFHKLTESAPGLKALALRGVVSAVGRAAAALLLAGWCLAAGAGCASGASTTLRSEADTGELRGSMTVLAYSPQDLNTADVFLSDLPPAALEPDGDLSGVSGQLTQLHVFMTPEAGNTPIDAGACSVVVRTIVVARGQLGVYGGGAFLNPNSAPGGSSYSGKISKGTCRLLTRTPGFVDKLGPSEFRASFRVPRNDAAVEKLQKRMATMLELAPPPPPAQPGPKPRG